MLCFLCFSKGPGAGNFFFPPSFFFNFNLKKLFLTASRASAFFFHADIKMHLDSEPKWPIQIFKTHAFSAGEAEKQPDRGSWGFKMGERNWSGVWCGGYSIPAPGSPRSCGPGGTRSGGGGQEAASGGSYARIQKNEITEPGRQAHRDTPDAASLTAAIGSLLPWSHRAYRRFHSLQERLRIPSTSLRYRPFKLKKKKVFQSKR